MSKFLDKAKAILEPHFRRYGMTYELSLEDDIAKALEDTLDEAKVILHMYADQDELNGEMVSEAKMFLESV